MSGIYVQVDADYDSDDKIIEAGPMAELLYVRSLAFCKRKLSDGAVKRSQLSVVGARIPNAKGHAKTLVDVGLWVETEEGWIVAAWSKRNRSHADVQAQREISSEAGIRGNHERWHIGEEGKPSSKCPLCRSERIGLPDRVPSGAVSPKPETKPQPKTEPKTDTKPITPQVPTAESFDGADEGAGDSQEVTPERLAEWAGRAYADAELAKGQDVKPDKLGPWKAKQLLDENTPNLERFAEWANSYRAWSGLELPRSTLAAAALGETRGLAQFPERPPAKAKPVDRISAEERARVLAEAGLPDKYRKSA